MEPLICLFAFRPLCRGRFSGNALWCCVHLIPYFPPLCKECNLIDQNLCISSLCNQEILLSPVSSGPDLVSSPNSLKWNTGCGTFPPNMPSTSLHRPDGYDQKNLSHKPEHQKDRIYWDKSGPYWIEDFREPYWQITFGRGQRMCFCTVCHLRWYWIHRRHDCRSFHMADLSGWWLGNVY